MQRSVKSCLTALLLATTFGSTPSWAQDRSDLLPTPPDDIYVLLNELTVVDNKGVTILPFRSKSTETLILPEISADSVWFLDYFLSRDFYDDPQLSIVVVSDAEGEWIYVDYSNDEDLTNDGPPAYFSSDSSEFVFQIIHPDDPQQVTTRILQRQPRWVRKGGAPAAEWFGNNFDDNGNLKSRIAQLYDTDGISGRFFFPDRVALMRGKAVLNGHEVQVGLYDANINGKFDDADDLLLVDVDGDGRLTYDWKDSTAFKLSDVFELHDKRYRLSSVDPYGRGMRFTEVLDSPTQLQLDELNQRLVNQDLMPRSTGSIPNDFWTAIHETIQGDTLSLSEYRGRTVLLSFWGEWCSPCVDELPILVEAANLLSDSDFVLIGVLNTSDQATAISMLQDAGATWQQIVFSEYLSNLFDVWAYPTNVFIGPDARTYQELGSVNMRYFNDHYISASDK